MGKKIQFHIWKFFLFHVILMVFFSKLFLMKNATKNNTSFEDNAGQNDHSSSYIIVCVAKFCVQTYPKNHLLNFHISSCCGCIMLCLQSIWVNMSCMQSNFGYVCSAKKEIKSVWKNSFYFRNNFINWYYIIISYPIVLLTLRWNNEINASIIC